MPSEKSVELEKLLKEAKELEEQGTSALKEMELRRKEVLETRLMGIKHKRLIAKQLEVEQAQEVLAEYEKELASQNGRGE